LNTGHKKGKISAAKYGIFFSNKAYKILREILTAFYSLNDKIACIFV